MGGITSRSLDAFVPGAIFTVLTADGQPIGELEQTGRQGLIGRGRRKGPLSQPLAPGMVLREKIRGVPARPTLRVGLDPSLGDDLEAAREALTAIERVEAVTLDAGGEVDYIFARMGPDALQQARAAGVSRLPEPDSLGLCSRALVPIPNAWRPAAGSGQAPIAAIVNELQPRLKMLLAGKILKSILNTDTSDVKIDANINPVNGRSPASGFSSRGSRETDLATQPITPDVQTLTIGTEIQLEIVNREARDLYIAALVIDNEGNLVILHPLTPQAAEAAARVQAGSRLTVPTPGDDYEFAVGGPAGFFELLVIASTEPLREAILALERISGGRGNSRSSRIPFGLDGSEAVNVMGALLGDIDRSSRSAGIEVRRSNSVVNTTKLAAISAIFEVVE